MLLAESDLFVSGRDELLDIRGSPVAGSAGRDRLEEVLSILDARLSVTAFVGGEDFSMADIPLGIMVYRWFNLEIERRDLPDLARWYQLLTERPAFENNVMIGLT